MITLAIRDAAPESYQVRPESLETFKLLLRIKQGEKRKRCHPKSVQTLTSDAFLKQKPNKQTSHKYMQTLDSSCISFCTSSGERQLKTSQVDAKLCQL